MLLWVLSVQMEGERLANSTGGPTIGVFTSVRRSQAFLEEEWLKDDPDEAEEVVWTQAEDEPHFLQAWDELMITRYVIQGHELDGGFGESYDERGLPRHIGSTAPQD